MKKCENCGNNHEGQYGSGRFCSSKCSRGFSTKEKRKEINEKVSKTLKKITLEPKECLVCKKIFLPKRRNSQKLCSKSCSGKYANLFLDRSIVDWSEVNKKSYAEGKNFPAGGTTKWLEYKDIKVQGTYEFKACQILDSLLEEGSIISWKYSAVRIPYKDMNGINRTYITDFLVETKESRFLLEVKGRETELDYLKWEAARDQGWELKVWRKKDLFY